MANTKSGMSDLKSKIFLYGPPGSGKSTIGKMLAESLRIPFYDLDERIQSRVGTSIPEIFKQDSEDGFRQLEKTEIESILDQDWGVIALGGGALLDPRNRERVSSAGPILCLSAPYEILLQRLSDTSEQRPLLVEEESIDLAARLQGLLTARADHYASFQMQLDTSNSTTSDLVWEAQILLGAFHVRGMGDLAQADPSYPRSPGYDVRVQPSGLESLGEMLRLRQLNGPVIFITDENVAALYLHQTFKSLQEVGYIAQPIILPPGEASKDINNLTFLWEAFLELGLERSSTVVALGGGVVGDLVGFAAATYKRGVSWVVVPTTLLAMADASLGGKTAIDLPQGKNLVGAYHAPRLVLTDPNTLSTLPEEELRAGLAEVVKAGVIGNPALFNLCAQGWDGVQTNMDAIVRQAAAVKIRIIEADPFERGPRAALNLGHTIGHAVELVSGFDLKHGEAVAIGMVAETRLAEQIGLAGKDLSAEIEDVLKRLGLPTRVPEGLNKQSILAAMQVDKKRVSGRVRFALPVRVGEVRVGVEIDNLGILEEIW